MMFSPVGKTSFAAAMTRLLTLLLIASAIGMSTMRASATAAEAQWIWSPKEDSPAGTCFFRKTFDLQGKAQGQIELTCDESYILHVNSVKVASDTEWKSFDTHTITPYLQPGSNVITVSAAKAKLGPAGLAARVTITTDDGKITSYSTDESWKTNRRRVKGWQNATFNDSRWLAAREIGSFGSTPPWNSKVQVSKTAKESRFKVVREFRVEWIVQPEDSGSILAMEFDEFGHIIASRENGPLLLIRDSNDDGIPDKVTTYCKELKNCQGILPLNGDVFATGDGPDGAALYRLTDKDRDGVIDQVRSIVKFKGKMAEHGPHSVTLGPDGLIYVLIGNYTELKKEPRLSSPYQDFYEGDLVKPRLEDPNGYARGKAAPGGTILRTDTEGSFVERYAGGLRNPYDAIFNAQGDLFTSDADMEWDSGLPWYRPTRVCLVTSGSEFGWRSGWAKWPDYYLDSLPGILDTGTGSPTGLASYEHVMYPIRYQNTLFVGDWAAGQIRAVKIKQQGASYTATSKVFLEGNPLNITDLSVGPDGALYFSTGGRDTEGGIYRVVWLGRVPKQVLDRGEGIAKALSQPQLSSAWARQELAAIKRDLGDQWDDQLVKIAADKSRLSKERIRALDLMQLFGPFPTKKMLLDLSQDRSSLIRAKTAYLMGLHSNDQTAERLVTLLGDSDERVARLACESLARTAHRPPVADLLPLLSSKDRFLATAARRTLERIPRLEWQEKVLRSESHRTFLVGSTALLALGPDKETCLAVLDRCHELTKGFITDDDFVDLLRVSQLAFLHGKIEADEVPQLAKRLASEYPAGNNAMNRELVRLLAHLKSLDAADRFMDQLKSDLPLEEKIHLVIHSPAMIDAWDTDERFELLNLFERTRTTSGSATYARYLDRVSRQFVEKMTDSERLAVLDEGTKWPSATLGAIARLPRKIDNETRQTLEQLDREMSKQDTPATKRLRTGIVAVLARSGSDADMAYLRKLFENEPDRRGTIAIGLAQDPNGENWPLLIRALSVAEGPLAAELLNKLAQSDRKPEAPEAVRQVILQGLKLESETGRGRAIRLLEHWTDHEAVGKENTRESTLAAWQTWFAEKYPLQPEPKLPVASETARYSFDELNKHLASTEGHANSTLRGKVVFSKAQCASCHRFGGQGEELGPDLSTISRRFQQKEILESIVYPSHVISDRFATQTVYTVQGKTHSGVVQSDGGDVTVLQADGKKIVVLENDVEEVVPNKKSTMPNGLLDQLTLEEIGDLFAYLNEVPTANVARGTDKAESSEKK